MVSTRVPLLTLNSDLLPIRLSCPDRIVWAVAHLIGHIPKYDHVTRYNVLHWLPVWQCTEYRLSGLVMPTCPCSSLPIEPLSSSIAQGSYPLCSVERRILVVLPECKQQLYKNHAFLLVGLRIWNGLPQKPCPFHRSWTDMFNSHLKIYLSVWAGILRASM